MINRTSHNTRIAGLPAQLPDEYITVDQIVNSNNIPLGLTDGKLKLPDGVGPIYTLTETDADGTVKTVTVDNEGVVTESVVNATTGLNNKIEITNTLIDILSKLDSNNAEITISGNATNNEIMLKIFDNSNSNVASIQLLSDVNAGTNIVNFLASLFSFNGAVKLPTLTNGKLLYLDSNNVVQASTVAPADIGTPSAINILTDTSSFNGNLTSEITNLQMLADAVDDLVSLRMISETTPTRLISLYDDNNNIIIKRNDNIDLLNQIILSEYSTDISVIDTLGTTLIHTGTRGDNTGILIKYESETNTISSINVIDGSVNFLASLFNFNGAVKLPTLTNGKLLYLDSNNVLQASEVEPGSIDGHTHDNKTLLDALINNGDGSSYLNNAGIYTTPTIPSIGDIDISALAQRKIMFVDTDGILKAAGWDTHNTGGNLNVLTSQAKTLFSILYGNFNVEISYLIDSGLVYFQTLQNVFLRLAENTMQIHFPSIEIISENITPGKLLYLDETTNILISSNIDHEADLHTHTNKADIDLFAVTRKETIYIDGGAFKPSTTNGAAYATIAETTSNKQNYSYVDFSATAYQYIEHALVLPDSWNGGDLNAVFYWTASGGSAGNVIWAIQGRSYGDNETIDQTWGTAQTVTDAWQTDGAVHKSDSVTFTLAGTPAGGEFVMLRVARQGSESGDSFSVNARLLGVKLEYTKNAWGD